MPILLLLTKEDFDMRKLMLAAAATGLLAVTAVGASAAPTGRTVPQAATVDHAPITKAYYGGERYEHRTWHHRWAYPRYAYNHHWHRTWEHGRWYDRY
jgi:hypothetical protein